MNTDETTQILDYFCWIRRFYTLSGSQKRPTISMELKVPPDQQNTSRSNNRYIKRLND